MRKRSVLLGAVAVLLLAWACSGDDEKPTPDLGLDGLLDLTPDAPQYKDEPFGRLCTNFNQNCPEKHEGFTLWCVGVQGGAAGKGFCTPQCSDVGNECFGVQNGLWAQCILGSEASDAGPGTKYCAFLCKTADRTWGCPPNLTCGKPDSQGNAICVP